MTVRAKFVCTNKEPESEGAENITLQAVYDSNPESENGLFFKYTPWGELKMGTINKEAANEFEIGKEYFIDFTKTN